MSLYKKNIISKDNETYFLSKKSVCTHTLHNTCELSTLKNYVHINMKLLCTTYETSVYNVIYLKYYVAKYIIM